MDRTKLVIEATNLSIEVWEQLAESGQSKKTLRSITKDKIKNMEGKCPLCQVLRAYTNGHINGYSDCPLCPLKGCGQDSYYRHWLCSSSTDTKKVYANLILQQLKSWRDENDSIK